LPSSWWCCSSAPAALYAYRRIGAAPPLVLTGIVTTNDVIVSPQIGGQIGQLHVSEGDRSRRISCSP
jgi:multidrug efflux pump subunit AcrA (membrane-fusion protein)